MLRVLLYPQEQRAFIPISARQMNWREGVYFPRNAHILEIWQRHLAHGV